MDIMNQDHRFQNQQYGYDHYGQAPGAGFEERGFIEKVFGPNIAAQMKSPLVATCLLLLVGIGFAGIIIASYPDAAEDEDVAVPVVQADAGPIKADPDSPGGMDIPFRDSTVFDTVQGPVNQNAEQPIENLLASDEQEEAVDKMAAIGEQVEEAVPDAAEDEADDSAADATGGVTIVKQEVVNIPPEELARPTKPGTVTETAAHRPELHTPGASPDTIAFVQSVLEKKDGAEAAAPAQAIANAKASQEAAAAAERVVAEVAVPSADEAEQAAAVEPAAGAASGAISSVAAPGDYFVQLASVPTKDATTAEWAKLQKKFSSELAGLDYNVQEANLGARGTFYRVRVGPYSKEYAASLCDRIKAQKPDACLVTK
ncbi:MAG TPA: hypothetical protein DEA55_08890 [Rhodospirillaceae bacterium]|nr:hypothetical protein [Rhodospirillaceae bacterium]